MTSYSRPKSAVRLSALLILISLSTVFTSEAKQAPDSIDVIQSLVPDSLNLDGKIVYVDFWASWCGPCRLSFPWMQALYNKYHKGGFEIVAVNVDKDHKAALEFMKDMQASFPVVFDSTGSLAKRYGVDAMPSSFIYGRDGRLVATHQGFAQDKTDSLDYDILQLLNKGRTK